ncbi:hypothetical protein M404DRAFT_1002548 [Pisolithus tinctorius Marx 270]|uniref:Uncharacterized protein n=1 Tax=Pisolithus tinctorius Marx 270 TaxID=870435 RepID=A0A0C3JXI4_PISTI|nr:hypothetical protein M404DRAFT_1002548 [Pisolithus tinctorius Marx 270]
MLPSGRRVATSYRLSQSRLCRDMWMRIHTDGDKTRTHKGSSVAGAKGLSVDDAERGQR